MLWQADMDNKGLACQKGTEVSITVPGTFFLPANYQDECCVPAIYWKGESMTNIAFPLLTLGLSLAPNLCWAAESNVDQAKAISEIRKSGCRVTVDYKSPGKDVIEVAFDVADHDPPDPKPNDTTLQYLRGFKQLQVLVLSYSDISDSGLVHLKGLTKLKKLFLDNTDVTDAGLAKLKGLSDCECLT